MLKSLHKIIKNGKIKLMVTKNIADLPLHYGSVPNWLFERQKKILFEISRLIIMEFGTKEFLSRLADPLYFQALGCISGFDWHSSGVTTTVCHALKETFNKNPEYGIFCFGGKGKSGLETPKEIENCKYVEEKMKFVFISKLTAKVDSHCIQDGYQLYHHTLFVDKDGNWVVIQQGMNSSIKYARRYHWFNKITSGKEKKFIIDPHTGIIASKKEKRILNLVGKKCKKVQANLIDYLRISSPENIIKELKLIFENTNSIFEIEKKFTFPVHHYVKYHFDMEKLFKNFCKLKNKEINSFVDIVLTEGVGEKTLRALSLIAEIVYGIPVSIEDPVKFSFAFGGKDGHPYPVDKENFDRTIKFLKNVVDKMKIDGKDKINIIKKLLLLENR